MVRPPVVEHYVAGLCDERNVNTPEAIEVAALVAACTEQPEYEDATMGVISLLGDEQYALIERFLHAWLEPQEIERESATGRATLYVVLTRATQRLVTVSRRS